VGSTRTVPGSVEGGRAVARPSDPVDRAWAVTALAIPAIVALIARMFTPDLAYHIRIGEDILRDRAIPTVDTYTFTVDGTSWQVQQWGASVLFSLLHRIGGWPTIGAARALLTFATFAFVFLACRSRGASTRAASLLTVGGFVVSVLALTMRPQLLVLPLFAAALWLLADRARHPGRVWLIPVLAAVSANLHGSFVLFPLLVGLALLEERLVKGAPARRLLVLTGITALATFVNPYGPNAWRYAADLATDPVIQRSITEWQPLDVGEIPGIVAFGAALAIAAYLARRGTPADVATLLTLGIFLWMAMASQRNIGLWGVVAPVAVAGLLPPSPSRSERKAGSPMAFRMLTAVLAVLIVVLLPWWRPNQPASLLADVPWGLADAAERELAPGTRTMVHQPWGSWFLFAAPELPVFLDSRIELIPSDVWEDYRAVAFAGATWARSLQRWDVEAVVAKNAEWDLIPILRDDPGWRVAYEGADGVLFVRR
jgi:hypothetical protein